MNDKEFLEREIRTWKYSPERLLQIKGYRYFEGGHDILYRKRTVIGEGGELQDVENLPNNRVVDNQYGKLVLQKANYILGQPFVIEGDNKGYIELLKQVFDKRFMRLLKNAGKAALNGGIAWLYPYFDGEGKLRFRLFPAYEVLPFWRDSEHTELDCAVRLYIVQEYEGDTPVLIEKAEVYDLDGVHRYIFKNGSLIPDDDNGDYGYSPYVLADGKGFNWEKNYDGTNLGEFRKNLATYGAVKVRSDGEAGGGVETLEINVNSDNYKVILEIFKKAIIENGMGFDAKDDRLSGNPNQMNIQSMYSDIDLDANDMETELQAAFEDILWFVNVYLLNIGEGDFLGESVNIIFNRDMLMNETEAIANCRASVGILSDETIVGQHPWVDDSQQEMERLKKQREEAQKEFEAQQGYNPFAQKEKGGINEE